ncbi:hypothetical protein M5G07_02515 [Serratia symbiotica]|nr:hypothetical protein [Serratia symbiotica]
MPIYCFHRWYLCQLPLPLFNLLHELPSLCGDARAVALRPAMTEALQ